MAKTFNHATVKVKNASGVYEDLPAFRGMSSYELAVQNGFEGTEAEWMKLMIGDGWIGSVQDLDNRKAEKTDYYNKEELVNAHVWRNIEDDWTVKYYTSSSKDEYSSYEYLGQIGEKSPRFQFVSYAGTDVYGEENPNSLTFDFAPDMVYWIGKEKVSNSIFHPNYNNITDHNAVVMMQKLSTEWTEGVEYAFTEDATAYHNYSKRSEDGKTIYWYNKYTSNGQSNSTTYIYHFVGIKFE